MSEIYCDLGEFTEISSDLTEKIHAHQNIPNEDLYRMSILTSSASIKLKLRHMLKVVAFFESEIDGLRDQ